MPVISEKKIGKVTVVLWRIDETAEDLGAVCSPGEMEYARQFSTDKRRREWLSWHAALRHLYPGAEVEYNGAGAPVLKNGGYLSVSHTSGIAAVAVSDAPCGIDVEMRDRNFTKAVERISDEAEILLMGKSPMPVSDREAVLWCAKEAMFKWAGEMEVDFKKEVRVTGMEVNDNILRGNVRGREALLACFFEDDLCVVCCGV